MIENVFKKKIIRIGKNGKSKACIIPSFVCSLYGINNDSEVVFVINDKGIQIHFEKRVDSNA